MTRLFAVMAFVYLSLHAFAQAPTSGPLGSRSSPYTEATLCSNPNVFFCEDFEDAATWPIQGVYGDCNQSGSWRNPAFQRGDNCYNNGSVTTPTITNTGNPGGTRVFRLPILGNQAASTAGGWIGRNGQGVFVNDYYVRYQFYLSSSVQFPVEYDIKQLFTQPEVFIDNPSADYQNGTVFHQDFFCSGLGNFNDVLSLRRSSGSEGGYQFPMSPLPGLNQYCPPLAVGEPANNSNSVRFEKNRWYTIEFHFKLGASGIAEMWVDGLKAFTFNNVRTCWSCNPMAYFMLTAYKRDSQSGSASVEYDNLVMSRSYIGPPGGGPPPPPAACGDGVDNDGDGLIDYPADPGCSSASDTDETNNPPPPPAQCADSIDNDSDGLIDYPSDPGCSSSTDNDEFNSPPPTYQCSDGLDNDADTLIDYPADPGCSSATDNDEFNAPPTGNVVVNFDSPAPNGSSGSYLNGIFGGINWGTNRWRWESGYLSDPTNHVYFANSSGNSRTFTFSPGPKLLKSMRVFTGISGTLTLTDNLGQTKIQSVPTGSMTTVTINWTQPSTTVTVKFNRGWELGVDDIEYVP